MSDPKNRPGDAPESFDAIAAANELAASLDAPAQVPPGARVQGESFETILEQEVDELNKVVESQAARIAQLEGEIEKSRSRIEKQSKVESEARIRKMLVEFLEVIDDLDRALQAAREGGHPELVIEGVELVKKSFLQTLAKFGVLHAPCLGAAFDPQRHDAVSMVRVRDPGQHNRVVGVAQEGYAIGEETLRPARVAVGKSG